MMTHCQADANDQEKHAEAIGVGEFFLNFLNELDPNPGD